MLEQYGEAILDLSEATRMAPEESPGLGHLALALATCPNEHLRDGKRAVELATKACELTRWRDFPSLQALAAAHAECGAFPERSLAGKGRKDRAD